MEFTLAVAPVLALVLELVPVLVLEPDLLEGFPLEVSPLVSPLLLP